MTVLQVVLRNGVPIPSYGTLARWADCGHPDAPDSEGARVLLSAADAALVAVAQVLGDDYAGTDPEDWGLALTSAVEAVQDSGEDHLAADGAVSVYTHARWEAFTDLCAYREDLSEYGPVDPDDLTVSVAAPAVYAIAYRVVAAMLDEVRTFANTLTED